MSQYFENDKNIKNKEKVLDFNYNNIKYHIYTDNGVFSKEHFDYGSRLLITSFLKNDKSGRVLDLGCGYGIIGIILSTNKKLFIDMVDINERALNLAKKNLKLNKIDNAFCFISDVYSNITEKYNYIITNPPIRAGKVTILNFLKNAKNHLEPNGELWFVMRKNHGVKSIIKEIENIYNIEIITKDKGFYIIECKIKKN